jgi:hypothetical protein
LCHELITGRQRPQLSNLECDDRELISRADQEEEAAMKKLRIRSFLSVFIFISSLSLTEAYGQNPLLRELVKEDQDSRRGKEIERTDEERIKIVLSLIGQGELKVPEDKFNAALILQHTGMTFCEKRLVSKSPDNYLLAHHLSKSAFEAGYENARQLVAMTIDRYLSMTEGYQKYGTSRVNNQETGKEELVPIDRKTTDSERARYGVAPLAELLKKYPEQSTKKPRSD